MTKFTIPENLSNYSDIENAIINYIAENGIEPSDIPGTDVVIPEEHYSVFKAEKNQEGDSFYWLGYRITK